MKTRTLRAYLLCVLAAALAAALCGFLFAHRQSARAETATAADVTALIDALPSEDGFRVSNADHVAAAQAAQAAYLALPEAEQANVSNAAKLAAIGHIAENSLINGQDLSKSLTWYHRSMDASQYKKSDNSVGGIASEADGQSFTITSYGTGSGANVPNNQQSMHYGQMYILPQTHEGDVEISFDYTATRLDNDGRFFYVVGNVSVDGSGNLHGVGTNVRPINNDYGAFISIKDDKGAQDARYNGKAMPAGQEYHLTMIITETYVKVTVNGTGADAEEVYLEGSKDYTSFATQTAATPADGKNGGEVAICVNGHALTVSNVRVKDYTAPADGQTQAVMDAIAALPPADGFTLATVTTEQLQGVLAVYEAYLQLTDEQKKNVNNISALDTLISIYNNSLINETETSGSLTWYHRSMNAAQYVNGDGETGGIKWDTEGEAFTVTSFGTSAGANVPGNQQSMHYGQMYFLPYSHTGDVAVSFDYVAEKIADGNRFFTLLANVSVDGSGNLHGVGANIRTLGGGNSAFVSIKDDKGAQDSNFTDSPAMNTAAGEKYHLVLTLNGTAVSVTVTGTGENAGVVYLQSTKDYTSFATQTAATPADGKNGGGIALCVNGHTLSVSNIKVQTYGEYLVSDVTALIEALPAAADVAYGDKQNIQAARTAYDALSADGKEFVKDYKKLTDAEQALATLITSLVNGAVSAIDALPAAEYTQAYKAKLDEAKGKYDALPAELKASVTNYSSLTAKLGEYNALKQAAEAAAAASAVRVKKVNDDIAALPAASVITLGDEQTVADVRTAYEALSADEKALITDLLKLTAAEEKIAQLKDASSGPQTGDKKPANGGCHCSVDGAVTSAGALAIVIAAACVAGFARRKNDKRK